MKKLVIVLFILVFSTSAFAQFSATAGVGFGGNLPYGDFKNLYKQGFSFEAIGNYGLPVPGLSLTLTSGYNTFAFKNEYINDKILTLEPNITSDKQFSESWNLNHIPIMFGVKYMVPDVPTITPYGTAEVGVNVLSFASRIASDINISTATVASYKKEDKTLINPGIALGLGTEISVMKVVTFDFNLKYYQMFGEYYPAFNVVRNANSYLSSPALSGLSLITYRFGVRLGL